MVEQPPALSEYASQEREWHEGYARVQKLYKEIQQRMSTKIEEGYSYQLIEEEEVRQKKMQRECELDRKYTEKMYRELSRLADIDLLARENRAVLQPCVAYHVIIGSTPRIQEMPHLDLEGNNITRALEQLAQDMQSDSWFDD